MINRTVILGTTALGILLALGCSATAEKQASTRDLNFEEQLTAALPLADQGFVLKVCNTNQEPGDHGSLSMSILSGKSDPDHPGKTIAAGPISPEKQLASILTLVDQDHSLNIRQVTDSMTGQPLFEFTIHK